MGDRSPAAVLAVDGGASKADVALVSRTGEVLGAARRLGVSNVSLSMENSTRVIADAIQAAGEEAGLAVDGKRLARLGVFCLAGADFPMDDRRISRVFADRGWTKNLLVRNDTFAVLRAGTDRGWGVAVVCGTGMNCVGLGPDGRTVRFPALGELSGDWSAGGEWIGMMALGAAIRGRDGRGHRTIMEDTVPAHFGLPRPSAVMESVHRGRLEWRRVMELTPLVFEAAAAGDGTARWILDQQADEVVAWAQAAIRRLRLLSRETDVILGGGVFLADDPDFLGRIEAGLAKVAPRAVARRLQTPPVVGAALLGLDQEGAASRAAGRLRATLSLDRLDGSSRTAES
jgi:N-acetylglucosamine kinase-like BadF-type ATPase